MSHKATDQFSGKKDGVYRMLTSTRSYKAHKGLTKQNLRDNMTNVELALNTLAEAATTKLSNEINPTTYRENVAVAKKGGGVAKVARE